jgi:hypothetical protein
VAFAGGLSVLMLAAIPVGWWLGPRWALLLLGGCVGVTVWVVAALVRHVNATLAELASRHHG